VTKFANAAGASTKKASVTLAAPTTLRFTAGTSRWLVVRRPRSVRQAGGTAPRRFRARPTPVHRNPSTVQHTALCAYGDGDLPPPCAAARLPLCVLAAIRRPSPPDRDCSRRTLLPRNPHRNNTIPKPAQTCPDLATAVIDVELERRLDADEHDAQQAATSGGPVRPATALTNRQSHRRAARHQANQKRPALVALAAAASIAAASRSRRACCSPQHEAATVPTSETRPLAAGVGHHGSRRARRGPPRRRRPGRCYWSTPQVVSPAPRLL
jgi:hypothetical protein